jgi:hypothetical protein
MMVDVFLSTVATFPASYSLSQLPGALRNNMSGLFSGFGRNQQPDSSPGQHTTSQSYSKFTSVPHL